MNALVSLLVCVCEVKEKLDKRFRPKFGKIINFDRTSTSEPIFLWVSSSYGNAGPLLHNINRLKGIIKSYSTYSTDHHEQRSQLIITSIKVTSRKRFALFSATEILKIKLSPRTSDNLGFALWRFSLNQYNQNSEYIQTFSHIYLKALCSDN